MRQIRWLVMAAAALAATHAQAAVKYRVEALPLLPQSLQSVDYQDINNRGEILGYGAPPGSEQYRAFVLGEGRYREIDTSAANGFSVNPRYLNDRGQIAMTIFGQGGPRPWLYTDGILKDLTPEGAVGSEDGSTDVAGLSRSGHVVGNYRDGLFFYDGTRSRYLDLGLNDGEVALARGMNDADVIVGSIRDPRLNWNGFMYDRGQITFLQGLRPLGINNRHQILAITQAGAMVIRNADDTLNEPGFFISDFNNVGWATGWTFPPYADDARAFLYRDGQSMDLNHLLLESQQQRWTLRLSYEMNDAGQILGIGSRLGGSGDEWFLATPVPESQSWALLLCGLGMVGAVARRHGRTPAL
ncbi:hypothetical protein [Azohydromonas caseinilytica]|uniref:PEP-CTERM protein-sorting domain-containing protein n=1 Tax=Azohydromonas caseinilytica TaxID=2728836 RepID=A0A848FGJ8_9BURK|nr:hypothetical protein [Azohydromonas caseinilytica]NML18266.1 hypothetical protein [Azohydromonas caseinilytica]